jgi:PAS domain S-box-containing protein
MNEKLAESNGHAEREVVLAGITIKSLEEENKKLRKFRKFFESAPIGFYRTSLKDGSFLMANPTCVKMLGFNSFEEMRTKVRASDLYPAEERQKFLEAIRKEGGVGDYEIVITLLDGREMNVLISGTVCEKEDCIEGSITDITDKKLMQLELEEYKAKGLAAARQTGFMIAAKLEEVEATVSP